MGRPNGRVRVRCEVNLYSSQGHYLRTIPGREADRLAVECATYVQGRSDEAKGIRMNNLLRSDGPSKPIPGHELAEAMAGALGGGRERTLCEWFGAVYGVTA